MNGNISNLDTPVKRLLTSKDMEIWTKSDQFNEFVVFITKLSESVKGKTNQELKEPKSENIKNIESLIQEVSNLVTKNPVNKDDQVTSRFGKIEFRFFYDDLEKSSETLLKDKFSCLEEWQVLELKTYLINSFGDRQRIDYGSGHELNFLCFLYVLYKYNNYLTEEDFTNIVLSSFIEYLSLMRRIEKEYWLEPAGSHGVWGLDDYHFLPFLFGASQLATHKHLKPKSIHNEEVVEMFAEKYLYFGCISFINSIKTTTSLKWHSPMLDDISGAKSWLKIAEGMIKMYKAEVLGKLPIMQHFFFGKTIKCPEGITEYHDRSTDSLDSCGHDNGNRELLNTWGDCCGIKVPSAIAVTAMKSKLNQSKGVSTNKPLPFD
ncbi:P2591 protein [Hanseniaspora valbyensis NRRL Y-1626]|uniref:Serine/threonine-protein phosphatase 2A activator n=1 Tax=Hanseniaspora valbyensis NRRL Y-1626 TaxID=766949 RepID=A0A1B7TH17_9ASCO|nr:P2591 protein [Hanseniaspora valbyensis NRRL Y-1626]